MKKCTGEAISLDLFVSRIPPLLAIGIVVYVYALVVMTLFQFVIIPYMSPTAENGLLAGDPLNYHTLAIDLAERIAEEGWGVWSLRPEGQGTVGIAAALYATTIAKPWMVIPLNAFLHALASVALIAIMRQIIPLKFALIASLYFIISPYQMHWYSQLNKDSFVAAGFFVFVYGWVLALRHSTTEKHSSYRLGLLLVVFGASLISIVRPYVVEMLDILNLVVVSVLILMIYRGLRQGLFIRKRSARMRIIGAVCVIALLVPLTRGAASDETLLAPESHAQKAKLKQLTQRLRQEAEKYQWGKASWLPLAVEKRLYAVVWQRIIFRSLETFTLNTTTRELLVDHRHKFRDAYDILAYLPRAFLIGLFEPLPMDWAVFFGSGTRSVFRIFMTGEMSLAYLSFFLLMAYLVLLGVNLEVFVSLAYVLPVITIYALATPHVGILSRFRYPYFILLMTLGVTLGVNLWLNRRSSSWISKSLLLNRKIRIDQRSQRE